MQFRHILAVPALAAALAGGSAARADVVAQSDAGFVIRLEADSPASPSAAWQGMVAPGRWWSDTHTYSGKAANMYLDAQATGCFCEKLPVPENAPPGQRMGSVEHMHVINADPVRGVLRLSGGLGPLQGEAIIGTWTVAFRPQGDGTRIIWEYVVGGYMRLKPEAVAPMVDKVMGEQLGLLAAYLAPPTGDEAGAEAGAKPASRSKPAKKLPKGD